ncbi:MAG: hypothetical protein OEW04_07370 [Nitrospirota bacterium]|nr:hypothetical protein [Nitrospirota bacterium]
MKRHNRTRVAYIAGRLITGKRIASLYDFTTLTDVEIESLPDADRIRELDFEYNNYAKGNAFKYAFRHEFTEKHAIDLTINGNTFMGRITGSSAYFIGNVRGDSIYIFDYEDAALLNYRISGCVLEDEVGSGTSPSGRLQRRE